MEKLALAMDALSQESEESGAGDQEERRTERRVSDRFERQPDLDLAKLRADMRKEVEIREKWANNMETYESRLQTVEGGVESAKELQGRLAAVEDHLWGAVNVAGRLTTVEAHCWNEEDLSKRVAAIEDSFLGQGAPSRAEPEDLSKRLAAIEDRLLGQEAPSRPESEDLSKRLATIEDRLLGQEAPSRAESEDLSKRLAAIEDRLLGQEAPSRAESEDTDQSAWKAEAASLASRLSALEESTGAKQEVSQDLGQDRAAMAQQLEDLRLFCNNGMERLRQAVEELVSVVGKVEEMEIRTVEVQELCFNHLAAARHALAERADAQRDLRGRVTALEERGAAAPATPTAPAAGEGEEPQMQALREQILSLSMRVSELAVNSDSQALQNISDECQGELDRHVEEAVKRMESSMSRTAMNGQAALEHLTLQQARVEQRLNAMQLALQAEFQSLLEELHLHRVPVDAQRFRVLFGGTGRQMGVTAPPTTGSAELIRDVPGVRQPAAVQPMIRSPGKGSDEKLAFASEIAKPISLRPMSPARGWHNDPPPSAKFSGPGFQATPGFTPPAGEAGGGILGSGPRSGGPGGGLAGSGKGGGYGGGGSPGGGAGAGAGGGGSARPNDEACSSM